MLCSQFLSLCFISSTLVAAAPYTTVPPGQTSIPAALQQRTPACAQPCLQKALAASFPTACTAQGDIECLCSRYGYTGESLGEMAFSCVYQYCARDEQSEASAYNVCLGQKDAVLPTKTAFTVVVGSTSPAKATSSTTIKLSSKSTVSATTILTSASTTAILTSAATIQTQTPSSRQSVFVDSISSTPPATSATSVASATSAPIAVTAEESRRMTPAQIAGLCVAAVASFVSAIGLMALSVCLRRRREQQYQQLSDGKSQGRRERKNSARFSHYVPVRSLPEPPKQSPLILHPSVRREDQNTRPGHDPTHGRPADWTSIRPVQRLGVGTSLNSSASSLPLDQIGLAISAEVDEKLVVPPVSKTTAKERRPRDIEVRHDALVRPFSTTTQNTVFEEDEIAAHRQSSTLLPTPPIPIAPIRKLQPSRSTSKLKKGSASPQLNVNGRKGARKSELFLDIPACHEKPRPRHIAIKANPSNGSPVPRRTPQIRIAPPIQTTSSSSTIQTKSTFTTTPVSGNGDDIPDYYFSRHPSPPPRASPAQFTKSKVSPRAVQTSSKKSMSTVSSHASTALRDSLSSQTSFETADPNDPTPEDEEDKQLSSDSNNKLSPVAELESPISKLRYPKVPRASNQCVPRSPKTVVTKDTKSLRVVIPDHSSVLAKHYGEKEVLPSETRMHKPNPEMKGFSIAESPTRQFHTHQRRHVRSNSDSIVSPCSPYIQENPRAQSGLWPSSPIMYTPCIAPVTVQPLNVRRGVYTPEIAGLNIENSRGRGDEGLKSPAWVPRLTPTRKGDDLVISVGWGR